MDKTNLTEEALQAINFFELRRNKNQEINNHIYKVFPDFPPLVQHMDSITESSFVGLLDMILSPSSEGLASYYLYEQPGLIVETDGKEWPLTNIQELSAYVYRNNIEE